jgi:ComF family protein
MKKNKFALFQSCSDLVFPRSCYGCQALLEFYENCLCLNCQINLPITDFNFLKRNLLLQKLELSFPVEAATSLGYFEKEGLLAHLIHLFKYQGEKKLGTFLGLWVGTTLKESPHFKDIEGLIPVPLHPSKRRKRGYNQAEILAKAISKKMKLPLFSKSIIRVKNTTALAMLGKKQRQLEVKNAFSVIPNEPLPKHLLLIDDVVTTGATLSACANALTKHRAVKLSIVVLGCRL